MLLSLALILLTTFGLGFTVVVVVEAIERFVSLVHSCFYKELSIETKSLVKLFSRTFSRSNYDRSIDLTLYQLRSNYESALTQLVVEAIVVSAVLSVLALLRLRLFLCALS